MSYVRFSEHSDLYIYGGPNGLECCGCKLTGEGSWLVTEDALEMIQHVEAHLEAGHQVPRGVIPSLGLDALEQAATDVDESYTAFVDDDDLDQLTLAVGSLRQALHYLKNDPAPESPPRPKTKLEDILADTCASQELKERHLDEWIHIRQAQEKEKA